MASQPENDHFCVHCGRPAPVRHHMFFIETVDFLVQATLFRVPRSPFDDHLQSFTLMVTEYQSDSREDASDASPSLFQSKIINNHDGPFRISDHVSAEEFESFLGKLMPSFGIAGVHTKPLSRDADRKEWMRTLKLATRWRLEELRNNAIDALTSGFAAIHDPFEFIESGKAYNIPQWLVMGYRNLITDSLPTHKDVLRLGASAFYHLMTIREEGLQHDRDASSTHPKSSWGSFGFAREPFDYDSRISTLIDQGALEGVGASDEYGWNPIFAEAANGGDMRISDETIRMIPNGSEIRLHDTFGRQERHSAKYYIDTVSFLVENTLFRVPRHRFESAQDSPFSAMFTLPAGGNIPIEGSSDRYPIKLPESIGATDFESFLRVLYQQYIQPASSLSRTEPEPPLEEPSPLPPSSYPSTRTQSPIPRASSITPPSSETRYPPPAAPPPQSSTETLASWISVLRLATQWQFDDIRNKAIDALSKDSSSLGDGIDRISLGREFVVSKWILSGFLDVLREDWTLTGEEQRVLGGETVVKLLTIKLEMQKEEMNGGQFEVVTVMTEKLKKAFWDELMEDGDYRISEL